jgi:hypothetical protein
MYGVVTGEDLKPKSPPETAPGATLAEYEESIKEWKDEDLVAVDIIIMILDFGIVVNVNRDNFESA